MEQVKYFDVDSYEYTKTESYPNDHRKKKIAQIDKRNGAIISIFSSCIEAEKATNIKHQGIIRVAKGYYHTAGGFKWEYVN